MKRWSFKRSKLSWRAKSPFGLNQFWCGDITYIRTNLGWVYLAVVLDLFNKEVIGYAISKNIDTELVKNALGNAAMESFFASLKKELIYRRTYADMDEVREDLFKYIELFYNRKRLHSSLGCMSPVAYRLQKLSA